jgi:hypothetical protein
VINAEEDQDELDRRFAATCRLYGISRADLGDRLFVDSICDQPMRIATLTRNNTPVLNQDVLDHLKGFISRRKIDVITLDPFISFHAVNESSNIDMDMVIKTGLGTIVKATNSACEIFHHPAKPKFGQETTVDDGRGATAILYAVRSARVLNYMTKDEASKFGVGEDVRLMHVRISNGKANTSKVGAQFWMQIALENLPNGDIVACSTLWTPPDVSQALSPAEEGLIFNAVQNQTYRADVQSPQWVGYAIAKTLGINVQYGASNAKPDLDRVKRIIKTLLTNNVLATDTALDPKTRKKHPIIIPGSTFYRPRQESDDDDPNLL